MPKSITPKPKTCPPRRLTLPWLMLCLIITIGVISFIYADGFTVLYRTWYSFTLPNIQLEVNPQSTIIATNSPIPIYIDLRLKNKQGQFLLLDDNDIITTILSGQADITEADKASADASKRLWLRAPSQPQLIALTFNYKHLEEHLTIEAYDPTPPVVPIIKAPVTGTNFTTATPTISGETVDNNPVEIYVDGILNSTIRSENNKFSGPLATALKRGKHKLTAAAVNKYGIRSMFTTAITIDIQTPDPEIDLVNLLIKPNPVKAGNTFQIFVPISSNTRSVQLVFDGTNYPLQDSNNSSVYSGIVHAPRNTGLYRLSIKITTTSAENILAEKVASIQVN